MQLAGKGKSGLLLTDKARGAAYQIEIDSYDSVRNDVIRGSNLPVSKGCMKS